MAKKIIRVGVIGYGYWGPNVVRNFAGNERTEVVAVSDRDKSALRRAEKANNNIRTTEDPADVLASPDIDLAAIVTPVSTHYEFAKKALENGKHVFVEKPFATSANEAEQLLELAAKKNLKVMVDHTFIFTGAVRKIKQLLEEGTLGDIYYYDSVRVNLGLFQHDVNVIWDLAPHDFAIMNYLVSENAVALSACGKAHVNRKEDVAYITVYFTNNMIAHFNVNWLSPVKLRTTFIGGERKMLVWNDTEDDEKIKVYDKGVEVKNREGVYEMLVSYRQGDVWVPKLDRTEALKLETEHFIDCILNDKTPINDGHAGLRVVNMLEACSESLRHGGKVVNL